MLAFSFPCTLARVSRISWDSFCMHSFNFLGCHLFQYPVWGILGKKKTNETHHDTVPQDLRFITPVPYFLQLSKSYFCFVHNVQDFSFTYQEEWRNVCLYHLPRSKSPRNYFYA